MKQSIIRKKKSVAGNPKTFNLDNELDVKATRLILLSLRIVDCIVALEKYKKISSEKVRRNFYINLINDRDDFLRKILEVALLINTQLNINTLQECFNYLEETIKKININERQSLEILYDSCLILIGNYFSNGKKGKHIRGGNIIIFSDLEYKLNNISHEAIGYWTAKLEHMKRSKNQETKKQQKAIKEKYVTETFLKLINNPTEKKILEKLSQNKIAKRIQDIAINDLQNVKTATGKPVLKRKIDNRGNIKFTGLKTDTIIDIMRKQDKFTFNPFKKNTSK
jgi:hypothetical protein